MTHFLLTIYVIRITVDNPNHSFEPFFEIYVENFYYLTGALIASLGSYLVYNGLVYMKILNKLTKAVKTNDQKGVEQPISKEKLGIAFWVYFLITIVGYILLFYVIFTLFNCFNNIIESLSTSFNMIY